MNGLFTKGAAAGGGSFLPEDYLEKKAERRANIIYLTLFAIVIFGVVAAFFVTNRQWSAVQDQQEAINVRYAQAARDIELLKELEAQKAQMLAKAELTTALIERSPRSLVLAQLINRMPDRLTLLQVELEAKRVKAATPRPQPSPTAKGRSSLAGQADQQAQAPTGPSAPTYETELIIIGVAASHNQVARYQASLQDCDLLQRVELKFSEVTIIDDRGMNKFRIDAQLNPEADARSLEPLADEQRDAFWDDESSIADANEDEEEGR